MGCCQANPVHTMPWPRNGGYDESNRYEYYYDHKIAVVGAEGVGKSALTVRMVANEWRPDIDPTIEDSYTCTIDINGKHQLLDILDTAQSEQMCMMGQHWIRECDNFVLVYSIQSERSFNYAHEFYRKILRNKEEQPFNIVLVGNKCDLYNECDKIQIEMKLTRENIMDLVYGYLRDGEKLWNQDSNLKLIPDELRMICLRYHGEFVERDIGVTYEMGMRLAKSWENEYFRVPFFETSAKTGESVYEAFKSIVVLAQEAITDFLVDS